MNIKKLIRRIFFPERCEVCNKTKPLMLPYCPLCNIEGEKVHKDACKVCGQKECLCDNSETIRLGHLASVYYYQGNLKRCVHEFKFEGEQAYAEPFGKAMADRIKEAYGDTPFDGISFVPMTKAMKQQRRYNHSELLARVVADSLGIPVLSCLEKNVESDYQKTMSGKERYNNIRGCFKAVNSDRLKGKTVLLCDDIKTTGATLKECSDVLLEAGAEDVYCISLAIGKYYKNTDFFA